MLFLKLFTIIVILEIVALYSIKRYSVDQTHPELLVLASLCYAGIPIAIYFILIRKGNVSTVNIVWNILSTMYGMVIGGLLFSEKITMLQFFGAILGVFSLIFIFYGQKAENTN